MTKNRIILPTERERKINYSYAWTGYHLDKTIEESDKRNSYFVSGWQFQEQTLQRLGINTPTVSSRKGVMAAFDKAHVSIVKEICAMQHREVKNGL